MGPLVMGHCVMGHFVMGRFVMGRFVCESENLPHGSEGTVAVCTILNLLITTSMVRT
jgi:hypothetical protein